MLPNRRQAPDRGGRLTQLSSADARSGGLELPKNVAYPVEAFVELRLHGEHVLELPPLLVPHCHREVQDSPGLCHHGLRHRIVVTQRLDGELPTVANLPRGLGRVLQLLQLVLEGLDPVGELALVRLPGRLDNRQFTKGELFENDPTEALVRLGDVSKLPGKLLLDGRDVRIEAELSLDRSQAGLRRLRAKRDLGGRNGPGCHNRVLARRRRLDRPALTEDPLGVAAGRDEKCDCEAGQQHGREPAPPPVSRGPALTAQT